MEELLRSVLPEGWRGLVPLIEHGVSVVAVVLVCWLAFTALRRVLHRAVARDRIDRTAASFVETVVRYGLVAVASIAVLSQMGVDTSSLLGSVGILGLTLGFAARDALSNVISGVFILWDRPFVIGDLIEIEGQYGRVDRITMRSTRVVTPDGKMLAIPHTSVVNTTVASYTNFPHLRLDVPIAVAVDEDLARVRELLLSVCAGPGFLDTPKAVAVVTQLNDYNVVFELRAWIEDETQHIPMRLALRERMFLALRDAGIRMPYETLEVRGA